MDLRTSDETTQLREMIDRALLRVNTAIPGVVESFDAATQTATVVPAVQMRTLIDNEEAFVTPPPIVNAPVVFPFASVAGFALTLPVRKGDPCIILFSQRAIDNWHELGGVQRPEEGVGSRHHDMTDAIVLLAAPPKPDVLGAWESQGIQMRNRAKTTHVTVRDSEAVIVSGPSVITVSSSGEVSIVAPSKVSIQTALAEVDAPLTTFSGNISVAGGITSTGTFGGSGGKIVTPGTIESTGGDVKAGNISLNNHTHGGVQPGGGSTGGPQ